MQASQPQPASKICQRQPPEQVGDICDPVVRDRENLEADKSTGQELLTFNLATAVRLFVVCKAAAAASTAPPVCRHVASQTTFLHSFIREHGGSAPPLMAQPFGCRIHSHQRWAARNLHSAGMVGQTAIHSLALTRKSTVYVSRARSTSAIRPSVRPSPLPACCCTMTGTKLRRSR